MARLLGEMQNTEAINKDLFECAQEIVVVLAKHDIAVDCPALIKVRRFVYAMLGVSEGKF